MNVPSRVLSEVNCLTEKLGRNFVSISVVPGTEKGEFIPPKRRSLLQADIILTVFRLTECNATWHLPDGPMHIRSGGRLPSLTVRPIIPLFLTRSQGGALAYFLVTLTCIGSCFYITRLVHIDNPGRRWQLTASASFRCTRLNVCVLSLPVLGPFLSLCIPVWNTVLSTCPSREAFLGSLLGRVTFFPVNVLVVLRRLIRQNMSCLRPPVSRS